MIYSGIDVFAAVIFGLTCIGLSFVEFGDSLVQISLTIFGTAGGPLVGIVILGMFFTFTESWVININLQFKMSFAKYVILCLHLHAITSFKR